MAELYSILYSIYGSKLNSDFNSSNLIIPILLILSFVAKNINTCGRKFKGGAHADINIDGYKSLTGTTDCRYDPEPEYFNKMYACVYYDKSACDKSQAFLFRHLNYIYDI
jgi:hypothetical protein